MDHLFIEEHDIADRYRAGKLSSEEEEAFELHLLDCKLCVARVQEFEGLRAGLEQVRRARPSREAAGWRMAAIAAAVVCAISAGAAYMFHQELTTSRGELAAAQKPSPKPETPNPALARASLYRLDVVRGELSPNRVFLPAKPEPIVFSFRLDPIRGAAKYRASLMEKSGGLISQQDELALDSGNSLALTFSSALLRPGDYVLRVEASSTTSRYFEVVSYLLQAVPRP